MSGSAAMSDRTAAMSARAAAPSVAGAHSWAVPKRGEA
jgi:hypothetical protein